MAVVNVKPMWSDNAGGVNQDGSDQRRSYTVLFDGVEDPALRPILARTATGIPRRREYIDVSYPFLRCVDVHAEPMGGPLLYKVTCEFSTRESDGSVSETQHPLDKPMEVEPDEYIVREPMEYDVVNGAAIVNRAGEPLEVDEDLHLPVAVCRRNEQTWSLSAQSYYANSVCTHDLFGWPAGTCWMLTMRAQRRFEHITIDDVETRLDYFAAVYRIVHNPFERPDGETQSGAAWGTYIGWQRRLMNQGLRWQDGTNDDGTPKYVNVKDKGGEPIMRPVPLKLDGTLLPDASTPTWLYFQTKRAVSWAPLHLE